MNHPTLTIEEVEQAFTDWRTNKNGNPPIPEDLWDQVKILLSTHRRGEVLRRLRLTTQQARDKGIISVEQYQGIETANSFIQIPYVPPTIETPSPPRNGLTLTRGDMHFSLEHPSDEQVQFIINTLLR